jgi:hypothetical protein
LLLRSQTTTEEDATMMPAPVQNMVLDLGSQLAPFAVGCTVFTLAMLGALATGMVVELRGRRPLATLRPTLRPVRGVQVDQAA